MFAKRINRLTSSLVRDILAAASRPGVISFAGGLPAEETLYRPDGAFSDFPHCWQYGQSEGEPALRELIAQRARQIGIPCEASQVLVLSGSQQGIDLVAKLFIDEETPVMLEAPAYLAAIQVFNLFGARLHGVNVDPQQGMDLQQFDQTLSQSRLAYLTPTFQNPSSYCYSDQERRDLAEILDQRKVPFFEDDPYRDLAYEKAAPNPIVSHLKEAPWVYQGSFSKTLSPGLRLGYLIAHPDLILPLVRLKQAADLHSNRLSQHLVHQILQDGLDAHIESVLPLYRTRRDAMAEALQKHMSPYAEWQVPEGGLFFWLTFNDPIDTMQLMRTTLEAGVAVMPGEAFYFESQAKSHLRLNFSHSTPQEIHQGIQTLAEIMRNTVRQS